MSIRLTSGLIVAFALAACSSTGGDSGPRFPPVSDYAAPGPFATMNHGEGPDCLIFRPETLGEGGLKHPIILWGNGTGTTPARYGALLDHWASHGFVVAAANTTNAGTGAQMLACLDWLETSDYAPDLNLDKVGTAGHSQGGGGSIMAGRDPRIDATAPFQPYTLRLGYEAGAERMQHGPMLLLSGGADTIADPDPNQKVVFDGANVPVFWASLDGASHLVPMGDSGGFRAPATAWFRAHLMGDQSAAQWFDGPCMLCQTTGWTIERKPGN